MGLSVLVDRKIRGVVAASLLAFLSACNTSDTLNLGGAAKETATQAMIQGKCPQIVLREGTAYHRVYANGARKMPDGSRDPEKLRYQAAIADTTRACRVGADGMVITVQAQGRIVQGPVGGPGTYKLPIRIAVADEKQVIFSQLSEIEVQIPQGQLSNQFLFQRDDVVIPTGAGDFATIYVGFDDGPKK